ncbi:hypothetical protein AX769_13970 [Frondihabitans sp. PAMC 28766]|nr:hypothetical protein AX769_13970 [Frondihabitans sp. PAMC 28766]
MLSVSDLPTVRDVKLVLRHLLERAEFPGAAQFLGQVDFIEGVSGKIDFLDLHLSPSAPMAPGSSNPLPTVGYVEDAAHESLGEILIWVTGGKIQRLEYAEYFHRYAAWPTVAQLYMVGSIQSARPWADTPQ